MTPPIDVAPPAATNPSVRLAEGEDASGMAVMLGDLLADNLRDYPGRARVARLMHGPVVMTASDHDRSITVRFCGKEIVIEEGVAAGAPAMAGPWLDLAQLCSGGISPYRAVRDKKLNIENPGRLDLIAAAGYVMSVPASYYQSETEAAQAAKQRLAIAIVVTIVLLVVIAMVARSRES